MNRLSKNMYAVLLCLLYFVSSQVCAETIEDFESLTVGTPLSQQGWTLLWGSTRDWSVVNTPNGQAVSKMGVQDGQAKRDAKYTSPIDESIEDWGWYSAVITPRVYANIIPQIAAGPFVADGTIPGYIGVVQVTTNETLSTHFQLRTADLSTTVISTDQAFAHHTYEVALEIAIADPYSGSTGTLYYKDLSLGETQWTKSSIQDIPLGFADNTRPSKWDSVWIRGHVAGEINEFKMSAGRLPRPVLPPGDPAHLSIATGTDVVTISSDDLTAHGTNVLQVTEDLTSGTWSNLTAITGTTSTNWVIAPLPAPESCYRIECHY